MLAVFAVLCAVLCINAYQDAVTLRDYGVRTVATVVEVHGGKNPWVMLKFTAVGRTVTAQVGNYDWGPEPRVGDRPTIIYDPSDPEGLVADVRIGPDFLSAWLLGVGALIAAALVWPTFAGRIDRLWGR